MLDQARRELRLFGIRVTAQRYDVAVDRIVTAAAARIPFRAHFCTVHSLVAATSDPRLADIFETADMVCTDGVPLVWLARRMGAHAAERCAGPDVLPAVCDVGRQLGLRHFFVGGQPGTAVALAQRLAARFPGLAVVGTAAPPFRSLTSLELDSLRDEVLASGAHIVWLGLGSPKQDFFAANEARRFGPIVVLPVGAAFDFHAGRVRRAPRWLRRMGLEWLFRLAMEPRRLLPRYLVTNSRFAWLLVREALKARSAR